MVDESEESRADRRLGGMEKMEGYIRSERLSTNRRGGQRPHYQIEVYIITSIFTI